MILELKHYLLAGRSLLEFQKFQAEVRAAEAAWGKFVLKHFPDYLTARPVSYSTVLQMRFEGVVDVQGPLPIGWEKIRGICQPDLTTVEGLSYYTEQSQLPIAQYPTSVGEIYMYLGRIYTTGFTQISDDMIIIHQSSTVAAPPDAVEVQDSQICALMEAEETKKKAASSDNAMRSRGSGRGCTA